MSWDCIPFVNTTLVTLVALLCGKHKRSWVHRWCLRRLRMFKELLGRSKPSGFLCLYSINKHGCIFVLHDSATTIHSWYSLSSTLTYHPFPELFLWSPHLFPLRSLKFSTIPEHLASTYPKISLAYWTTVSSLTLSSANPHTRVTLLSVSWISS